MQLLALQSNKLQKNDYLSLLLDMRCTDAEVYKVVFLPCDIDGYFVYFS